MTLLLRVRLILSDVMIYHFIPQSLYIVEKVHCVWFADGEIIVLFESKQFDEPHHLGVVPIELKELVRDYLDKIEYIPHIKRTVTLEPTRWEIINKH